MGPLTLSNVDGFVDRALKAHRMEGGTRYGAAMQVVRRHYVGSDEPRTRPHSDAVPVYVMLVTDGAPDDRQTAIEQVRASSYEPLSWQFMAIAQTSHKGQFAFREGSTTSTASTWTTRTSSRCAARPRSPTRNCSSR